MNLDLEALARELREGDDPVNTWEQATEKQRNYWRGEAEYQLASRATVPDAATEAGRWYQLYEKGVEERVELRTERDVAVAAIERVHGILNRDDFGDSWEHDDWVYRDAAEKKLSEIEEALDGAPEPEWEWGYRGETLNDVHTRKSRESAEGAVKDLTEYWALHGKKFELVRRRKAGPWEPVEGEKR